MAMNPRLLRPRQTTHPEAAAWAARVSANGAAVSGPTLAAVSRFCQSIDLAGIRGRFSRLNLFCGTGLNACLVPLYRSTSASGTPIGNATDTNVGGLFVSGDYSESVGLTGNGTSKYLDTGFNVSSLPAAANCHLASYIRGTQDITSARTLLGTLYNGVTDRYRIFMQPIGGGSYRLVSELGKSTQAFGDQTNASGGLFISSRTSTTSLTLYRAGSLVNSNATLTAEDATGAVPILVFARNGPVEYYNGIMAGYSIGAGLSATQAAAYNTAMQAFQTALGRNV